jgi:hypothetical protein
VFFREAALPEPIQLEHVPERIAKLRDQLKLLADYL